MTLRVKAFAPAQNPSAQGSPRGADDRWSETRSQERTEEIQECPQECIGTVAGQSFKLLPKLTTDASDEEPGGWPEYIGMRRKVTGYFTNPFRRCSL